MGATESWELQDAVSLVAGLASHALLPRMLSRSVRTSLVIDRRNRHSRPLVGCVVVLMLSAATESTLKAFNYSEHRLLNQEAISLIPDEEAKWIRNVERREWAILSEHSRVSGNNISSSDVPAL